VTTVALTRPLVGVRRLTAFLVGGVFGLTLSWSGMTDPDVLRNGLLFRDAYLMLFFASALATAFVGLRILRARRVRSVLGGEPLSWSTVRPERRHVVGSALFGIGWATADVCPGPIAAQLGQGVPWALATAAGLVLGVWTFNRRSAATEE
jgi:uncharacterized membrane protein YedE/YeeE